MADWYTAWRRALLKKGIVTPERPWNDPIWRQSQPDPQEVKSTGPQGNREE